MTIEEQTAIAAMKICKGWGESRFIEGVQWERQRIERETFELMRKDPVHYFRASILRAGLSQDDMESLSEWLSSYPESQKK